MHLIVPTFPFTPDAIQDAAEFRECLAGLMDEMGADPAHWEDLLCDEDFAAALEGFWAFMSGRAPGSDLIAILRDALQVTEEQFTARIQNGKTVF